MQYKAFVSSTFLDLHAHRARVVAALQHAGIHVDPMEQWTAASDAPEKFSADRLRGCNLCVLLVAFQRGQIPEGKTRSITQIEYDEARKRGIEILPFLLEENAPWDARFDDRERDPEVARWRRQLTTSHGAQRFGADPKTIEIDPAISRWVVETESKRADRYRRGILGALAVVVAMLIASTAFAIYASRRPSLRSVALFRFLRIHDPAVFYGSPVQQYELARIAWNYDILRNHTNLGAEIAGTTRTFDLLANNAQYIRNSQRDNILNIIRRGGRVRVILWDYSEPNRVHYDAFLRATEQPVLAETRAGAVAVDREVAAMQRLIAANKRRYPGSLELRWNQKPLFYTMWLRDYGVPSNTLAHLGIHFYRGQDYWPALRLSRRDGARMIENMHAEFEHAWAAALPRPAGPS
jgi:hypothetical protein